MERIHISGSNETKIPLIFQLLIISFIAVFLLANTRAGCGKTESAESVWNEVGKSFEGRPIRIARIGEGPRSIFLFGVIHGNEPTGKEILKRLYYFLKENPMDYIGKRILIMPVANPDGLAKNTRANANGVDLNRNFPTRDWTRNASRKKYAPGSYRASEPEIKILIKIIEEERPDLVVSIHQPLRCINYDGPAMNMAKMLVRYTGLPLKHDIGYNTPGSLGTYAGVEKGISTITIELPRKVSQDELNKKYLPALVQLIRSF